MGPLWEIACAKESATRAQAADVLKQLAARLGNGFVDESLSVLRAGRPGVNPILPHGPEADEARKAINRLKGPGESAKADR